MEATWLYAVEMTNQHFTATLELHPCLQQLLRWNMESREISGVHSRICSCQLLRLGNLRWIALLNGMLQFLAVSIFVYCAQPIGVSKFAGDDKLFKVVKTHTDCEEFRKELPP